MSSSKQKGTRFETSLVPAFEAFWPGTIRRPGQGTFDKGDLYMPGNTLYVVEAKTAKTARMNEWWEETEREARNAGVPFGVLVHKRAGVTAPEEQWATMSLGRWLQLAHRL